MDGKTNQSSIKTDIVVVGAGQAGLSTAYYLKKKGLTPEQEFVVLDNADGSGGAWQYRWDSLTLKNVNGINDLPGMPFSEIVGSNKKEIQANEAVPKYYDAYEKFYELPVIRPVEVERVFRFEERFLLETSRGTFLARGLVGATGTWQTPRCPLYPGYKKFRGKQLHTSEYQKAEDFIGKHVVIVGAGISAIQMLAEVSEVTATTWVTRRPPAFREGEFTPERGRAAVAKVEERVRQGLPPQSVVSLTGIPVTEEIRNMKKQGVLQRKPMFDELTETGIRWKDGTTLQADVIFWNTGFRHSLDYLAPLNLMNEAGGITMAGRLATQVKKDPRIHLPGYGPSASTIGANRAGRAVAEELMETLGLKKG